MTTATFEPLGSRRRQVAGRSKWQGSFRGGTGSISADGTGLEQAPYTFASRFEGGDGASPEALLAAAHAACLNHAVANFSEIRGMAITTIETTVELTTGRDDLGPAIVGAHVSISATGPAGSDEQFLEIARSALANCAIGKALKYVPSLTAIWTRQ